MARSPLFGGGPSLSDVSDLEEQLESSPVIKTGYLRKLKKKKRKWFVLLGATSLHPARSDIAVFQFLSSVPISVFQCLSYQFLSSDLLALFQCSFDGSNDHFPGFQFLPSFPVSFHCSRCEWLFT